MSTEIIQEKKNKNKKLEPGAVASRVGTRSAAGRVRGAHGSDGWPSAGRPSAPCGSAPAFAGRHREAPPALACRPWPSARGQLSGPGKGPRHPRCGRNSARPRGAARETRPSGRWGDVTRRARGGYFRSRRGGGRGHPGLSSARQGPPGPRRPARGEAVAAGEAAGGPRATLAAPCGKSGADAGSGVESGRVSFTQPPALARGSRRPLPHGHSLSDGRAPGTKARSDSAVCSRLDLTPPLAVPEAASPLTPKGQVSLSQKPSADHLCFLPAGPEASAF